MAEAVSGQLIRRSGRASGMSASWPFRLSRSFPAKSRKPRAG